MPTRSKPRRSTAAMAAVTVAALLVAAGALRPQPEPAAVTLPVVALIASRATGDACVARAGEVICTPGFGAAYVVYPVEE